MKGFVITDRHLPWPDVKDLVRIMQRHVYCLSWGARNYAIWDNKVLSFIVSGRKYKGRIFVSVNGHDLLDVTFTDSKNTQVKHKIEDVYIDQLLDVIDAYVEN